MSEVLAQEEQVIDNSVLEVDAKPQPEPVTNAKPEVTIDGIRNVVTDAVNSSGEKQDASIQDLGAKVGDLQESIRLLSEKQEDSQQSQDVVYVVRLDSSQVDTAKAATRVVCTEGLILIILLAVSCGLQAWRVLSGRWSNG